jgi:hypothetical protein
VPSKDLLPCPFCGGHAAANQVRYHDKMIREQEWSQDTFYGVNCVQCGVNNLGLVGHRTPEKAAERWNTRHAHEPTSAADEPSACSCVCTHGVSMKESCPACGGAAVNIVRPRVSYSQACDLLARYHVALGDRECCGDEFQPQYIDALNACLAAMGHASAEHAIHNDKCSAAGEGA